MGHSYRRPKKKRKKEDNLSHSVDVSTIKEKRKKEKNTRRDALSPRLRSTRLQNIPNEFVVFRVCTLFKMIFLYRASTPSKSKDFFFFKFSFHTLRTNSRNSSQIFTLILMFFVLYTRHPNKLHPTKMVNYE